MLKPESGVSRENLPGHQDTDDCDDIILDDATARDLMHAGKDAHEKIAYRFIDLYNVNRCTHK